MPEYEIPDGTEKYRIVVNVPGRPDWNTHPATYYLWSHRDRYYNTVGGVKQIINGARKMKDFFDVDWHIEKGVVSWEWKEVDIYASSPHQRTP